MRTLRASIAVLLCMALTPAVASAAAPVLNSVTVTNGKATIKWSLPKCVQPRLVETAVNAPSTDNFGYFYPQANIYSFDVPSDLVGGTSVVPNDPLNGGFKAGTYWAHVGGEDTSKAPPRPREFSNVVQFTVNSFGYGSGVGEPAFASVPCPTAGGGTGGGKGGGSTVNKVTPFGNLSYKRTQSISKLFVIARSNEAGTLKATGTVSVPGAAKVYRFRTVKRKVAATGAVKLRLKLAKKKLRAVKRALKKGKRLKAKITVTAVNTAGIARSQKATIKLKR